MSVYKTSPIISKTINAITKNGRPRCRALKLVDFEEITQFGFSSLWQGTNVKKWTACKGKSLPKKEENYKMLTLFFSIFKRIHEICITGQYRGRLLKFFTRSFKVLGIRYFLPKRFVLYLPIVPVSIYSAYPKHDRTKSMVSKNT